MLHIVGASSLYHSIKNLAPAYFTYTGTTHATPSLQLNYRVSDDYNAWTFPRLVPSKLYFGTT